MRKTVTIPALVLGLGLGCLVLTGCGQQQAENNQGNTSDQEGEQSATTEERPQDQGEDQQQEEDLSVSSILSRGSDMSSARYDLTSKVPGQDDYTARIWWEADNMRVESTMSTQGGTFSAVYLIDMAEETSYVYMPEQGRAIKRDYSRAKEKAGDSPKSRSASIKQKNPVITGEETLNGKDCVVVEYNSNDGDTIKSWIWKERGFPIKTVTPTDKGEQVTIIDNIELGDIPDSKFELPEGVEVMDIPSGIPSNIPSGVDSGNMPDMDF